MKQSTKLLSLVLALVLAFGCFSVIGNAALVKSEVAWDNIDDAKLTAEQVADLALDMVDADVPMLCLFFRRRYMCIFNKQHCNGILLYTRHARRNRTTMRFAVNLCGISVFAILTEKRPKNTL